MSISGCVGNRNAAKVEEHDRSAGRYSHEPATPGILFSLRPPAWSEASTRIWERRCAGHVERSSAAKIHAYGERLTPRLDLQACTDYPKRPSCLSGAPDDPASCFCAAVNGRRPGSANRRRRPHFFPTRERLSKFRPLRSAIRIGSSNCFPLRVCACQVALASCESVVCMV